MYRAIEPAPHRDHGYVLMTMRRDPVFETEERYREVRQRTLMFRCDVTKLHRPELRRLVGLAFGAEQDRDQSIDFVLHDFDEWSTSDAVQAEEIRVMMRWAPTAELTRYDVKTDEYPLPPDEPAPRSDSVPGKARKPNAIRRKKRKAQRDARRRNRK